MWLEIFREYVTDHVAFVVHVYLLGCEVLATIALGFGIVWESNDAPPQMHPLARKMVLMACVAETVCSVALFSFDEIISLAQQNIIEAQGNKIIVLETRLAPRLLTAEQIARIAEKIKPFGKMPFDMSVAPGDPEAMTALGMISQSLTLGGWDWTEFNHPNGPFMTVYSIPGLPNIGEGLVASGIDILVHPDHESSLFAAAKALSDALNAEGLAANARVAELAGIPNHNTIHVGVGKKPQ
jgi:hypothetical protein